MAVSSATTWGEDAVEDYHSEFCHGIYLGCTFEAFYSFVVIDLVKKNKNSILLNTLFRRPALPTQQPSFSINHLKIVHKSPFLKFPEPPLSDAQYLSWKDSTQSLWVISELKNGKD